MLVLTLRACDGSSAVPQDGVDATRGVDRSVAKTDAPRRGSPDAKATAAPAGAAQSDAAAPNPKVVQATPGRCPDGMLLVPGGSFTAKQYEKLELSARQTEGALDTEIVVSARVDDFCLDRTEFTHGRARRAGHEIAPTPHPGSDTTDEIPVEVDYVEAVELCASERGRLPTYEEWMWAYWGGDEERRYPWGNNKPRPDLLNVCDISCNLDSRLGDDPTCVSRSDCPGLDRSFGDDGWTDTAHVGSFPKGAARWGQLDMEGNVDELVVVRPTLRSFLSSPTPAQWTEVKRRPPVHHFFWSCASSYDSSPRDLVTRGWRRGQRICMGTPYLKNPRDAITGFRCAASPSDHIPPS